MVECRVALFCRSGAGFSKGKLGAAGGVGHGTFVGADGKADDTTRAPNEFGDTTGVSDVRSAKSPMLEYPPSDPSCELLPSNIGRSDGTSLSIIAYSKPWLTEVVESLRATSAAPLTKDSPALVFPPWTVL